MLLHLYRLSLTERRQKELFEETPDRYDFLFRWFGESFDYSPRKGVDLRYIVTGIDESVIAGVIARKTTELQHSDDQDPFVEREGVKWETGNVFLNVGDDEQVIGVELNRSISADTRNLIKGLVEAINEKSGQSGFKVDVFPVHEKAEFWEAVSSFSGPITSLTFDLVVPNPPDTTSPTKEAMKELQRRVNARTMKQTIANPEGLDLNNEFVQDREQYAASGGGDVIARSGNKIVFSSKRSAKTVEVDDSMRASGQDRPGLFDRLRRVLTR